MLSATTDAEKKSIYVWKIICLEVMCTVKQKISIFFTVLIFAIGLSFAIPAHASVPDGMFSLKPQNWEIGNKGETVTNGSIKNVHGEIIEVDFESGDIRTRSHMTITADHNIDANWLGRANGVALIESIPDGGLWQMTWSSRFVDGGYFVYSHGFGSGKYKGLELVITVDNGLWLGKITQAH